MEVIQPDMAIYLHRERNTEAISSRVSYSEAFLTNTDKHSNHCENKRKNRPGRCLKVL